MRVAIIPARGGSRRIPRKNIREFRGKPIIAYSIEAAKASGLFDEVFVTTDDAEIALVAQEYGAHALARPTHLADDHIGTQDVTRWVLDECLRNPPNKIEAACCIYATCPMLTPDDLKNAWVTWMVENDWLHYVLAEGWFYWGKPESFGVVPINIDTAVTFDVGDRWIDINVESDWLRAEQMYRDLHKEVA